LSGDTGEVEDVGGSGGSGTADVTAADIVDAGAAFPAFAQAETKEEQWAAIEPSEIEAVLVPVKGTPEVIDAYIGTDGEFTSDSERIRLMDGVNAGGIKMATASDLVSINSHLTTYVDESGFVKADLLTTIPANWQDGVASKYIRIGDVVTAIGNSAFSYNAAPPATGFDLIIPDSVLSIGEEAFYATYFGGGRLRLGKNIVSIGMAAFGEAQLTGPIEIPESLTSLGEIAFFAVNSPIIYCRTTKTVIDASPNDSAFGGTGLTTLYVRQSDSTWTAGTGLTIGGVTGVTVIKNLI
jgi:hypothetical protein